LAHGSVVSATIAKGRIRHIDIADAMAVDGVIAVFTHTHRPKLAASDDKYGDDIAPPGAPFRPLYDDQIRFSGQPVALVVAEELEISRFAASLVRIDYEPQQHTTAFEGQRSRAGVRDGEAANLHKRGDPEKAFAQAPVRVEAEYRMPVEHHNPMEMFGKCGRATAASPSTTRRRGRRTAETM
jgi:xanthine dehydrogenase YagR molybdenum-binding subunit